MPDHRISDAGTRPAEAVPEDASESLSDGVKWNKAARLAIAGIVAPHLRDRASEARSRRVARVDKDGNVVGYTTLANVQTALLERAKIEFDVAPGTRPKKVPCQECGRLVSVGRIGHVPKRCLSCNRGLCEDCGVLLSKSARSMGAKRCRGCVGTAPKPKSVCVGCGKRTYRGSVRCKSCNVARIRKAAPSCEVCEKPLVNRRARRCKRHASKVRRTRVAA